MLRSFGFMLAAAIGSSALLCGCSAPTSSGAGDAVTNREQQAVSDLKTRYKDVVTGTDVQNQTLAVYVDVNNIYSMDEDAEAAMKAQALREWKRVWSAAHPHRHASLRLSMRDYYGKEIYSASTRV